MKKILLSSLLAVSFLLPAGLALATATTWDYNGTILQPLVSQKTAQVNVPNLYATSTTATSTLKKTNITGPGLTILGEYFTNFTNYVRSLFTQGTGIGISGGVISNTGVTSIVAGSNVTISGATGAVTINSTASGAGGSGTVSTSTNEISGRLSYFTSNSGTPALLGQVATSSIGAGTGLTFSGTAGAQVGGTNGTYSVNTSQNITNLTNLNTAGIVKTTGTGGALSIGSNGTDYTLITAKTCNLGDFMSAATAAGVFTCTTPSGTSYTATYPIIVTGSVISTAFGTTTTWGLGNNGLIMTGPTGVPFVQATSSPISLDISGNAATATKLATARTIAITGDLAYTSPSFDGSGNVTAAGTLATVNTNTGSFGGTNSIPSFTVNGKGLITAAAANTPSIPASEITSGSFGSGNYTFPADLTITGNATSSAFFATTASTTKLFGSNLQACTGTNALTYSGGLFGCAAQPQGTVTGVTATYPIASTGGATPVISTNFGTTTGWGLGNNGLVMTGSGGAPFIQATSSPINLNISGNAATVTTNANLSGVVTSSGSNVTSFGSQSAGILGNPATGNTAVQATSTLYGAVQNGKVLAGSGGLLTYVATSTDSCSSGVTCSYSGGTNSFSIAAGAITNAMLASTYVTSLTFTTGQGVSGSFTAGAIPAETLTLGALTGVTSFNGLVVTANTGTITTGIWNGTTIAIANGGTNATSFTTTGNAVYYDGTRLVTAPLTSSVTTPFASSTAMSASNINFSGQLFGNDTATSFTGIISPVNRLTLQTGTTTSWTATTSGAYIPHATAPFAGTIKSAQCSTDASFLGIDISIGTTHLTYFVASTTVGTEQFTSSNTFTNGQQINMSAGTTTTSGATNVNCTLNIIQTT